MIYTRGGSEVIIENVNFENGTCTYIRLSDGKRITDAELGYIVADGGIDEIIASAKKNRTTKE